MIQDDPSIYMDGFGDQHTWNGGQLFCIVGDRQTGRSELDQGFWATIFPVSFQAGAVAIPSLNDDVTFDGSIYTVEDIKNDGSVVTITLATPGRVGEMMG